jgi:hypothetical protein
VRDFTWSTENGILTLVTVFVVTTGEYTVTDSVLMVYDDEITTTFHRMKLEKRQNVKVSFYGIKIG